MAALQWGVVLCASLAGAVSDIGTRRVPNWLTGPVLLGGLLYATWVGGAAGLADAASACVLLGLPYVLLFVFAGGGAGDAKLMGALGAWLGVRNAAVVLVAVAFAGILLSVGSALAKRRLTSVLVNLWRILHAAALFVFLRGRIEQSRDLLPATEDMQKVPYAVAIFLGVCMAAGGLLLWGP
jgi:prepilin peptidase CpaA